MALAWTQAPRAADDPEAAIRAALEQWRQDFNARRAEHICDLFAPELLYDFQGLPEQNYTLLCDRLHKALADQSKSFIYGLRIKEVIVSGSLAVVRLTWISTFTDAAGKSQTDDEEGLDVFARQPNGSWKIIRYIAYPAHPE
jgi:steroid delta-isomerase